MQDATRKPVIFVWALKRQTHFHYKTYDCKPNSMKIFTLSLQNIWLHTELLSSCRPQWIRVDINTSIHNPTPNCVDVNDDNHDDKRAAHNEFVSTSMTIDDKWQHAHNEFVSTSIRHVSTSQWQLIMTNIRMLVVVNDNGQMNSTGDTMHNKRISFCTHNEFVSTSIDDASMSIDRWQMNTIGNPQLVIQYCTVKGNNFFRQSAGTKNLSPQGNPFSPWLAPTNFHRG